MNTGKISSELKKISVDGELDSSTSFALQEQRIVVETNAFLPPSAEVRAYEEMCPGAAQIILNATVAQSEHRREMERQESERRNERRRLEAKALEFDLGIRAVVVLVALIFCAVLLAAALVFLWYGKWVESAVSLAIPTISLVGVLVRAVFRSKSESDQEKNGDSESKNAA